VIRRAFAGPSVAGKRLDDGVKTLFPEFSKGRIRKVIDLGGCRVGQAVVRVASRPLREGDEILFAVAGAEPDANYSLSPADILLDDPEYLLLAKPAGVYTQRTPYQLKGTVEFAVDRHFRAAGVREPARVVHRLDRETSGVMVFPKNRPAAAWFSDALKEGRVGKVYRALVAGSPAADSWESDAPIAPAGKSRFAVEQGGRQARTAFRVLSRGNAATLVEARPRTGRTHQIRLHLAHDGHPVLGDDRYGGPPCPRMMLHCRAMSFRAADGRPVSAEAPPDATFVSACEQAGIVQGDTLRFSLGGHSSV
jgi:RluA family pseudouridine synthase